MSYRLQELKLDSLEFGSASIRGCAGECTLVAADKDHPNKLPFTGVLLILDAPSNQPPHGAESHRILVPKSVAKKRLSTLVNMGLNYAPSLDSHAPRRKVGVITGAWIDGNKLKVRGFVWKKDFPEAAGDLRKGGMGMSMELADVYVRDKDEQVWHLTDFKFSGATALYKKSAAYYSTALAAASAALGVSGGNMKEKPNNKGAGDAAANGQILAQAIAAGIGPAITSSMEKGLAGVVTALEANNELLKTVATSQAKLSAFLVESGVAAGYTHEEDEEAARDASAAKSKSEEDEDEEAEDEDARADDEAEDEEAAGKKKASDDEEEEDDDSDDDEEDLEAALADLTKKAADEPPGQVNKHAKNQGRKSTVTLNSAGDIAAAATIGRIEAANQKLANMLRASHKKHKKEVRAMRNKVEAMEAQLEAYTDRVDRKSVPAELRNVIEKSGSSVEELFASGRKLSVPEVDNMLAASGVTLDPKTRMALKNMFLERGLMEMGEVVR